MRIIRGAVVLYRCGVTKAALSLAASDLLDVPRGHLEVMSRPLQPRPMISFSRANHHVCPSFSSHFRRDPQRGKAQDLRFSAAAPGHVQMGNVGPNRSWTPECCVQKTDPRSRDQAFFFCRLPQQRSKKMRE